MMVAKWKEDNMIKITNLNTKDWNGTPFKEFQANDGVNDVKASYWYPKSGDTSFYDSIVDGAEIDGILVKNEKGYWNLRNKLTPPSFVKKGEVMEKAMDKKASIIEASQDRKEYAIRLSMTMELAVRIAIAENNPTLENIYSIRKNLWENWDIPVGSIPF